MDKIDADKYAILLEHVLAYLVDHMGGEVVIPHDYLVNDLWGMEIFSNDLNRGITFKTTRKEDS